MGAPIRLPADFSVEILQARRNGTIYQCDKREKKSLQPRVLYHAKLSYRIEGKLKSFQKSKAKRVQHHKKC